MVWQCDSSSRTMGRRYGTSVGYCNLSPGDGGTLFDTEVLVFWQVHIPFGRCVEGEGRGGERVRSLGLFNLCV